MESEGDKEVLFAKQTGKTSPAFVAHCVRTTAPSPNLGEGRGEVKKTAFTLAEVLITLGIIGVMAAMTMPTVINNYKNKETVAKLKKAYSTLNQAFRMSESVNEASEYWENSFDIGAQAYYEKYWKPFFNNPTLCLTYKECGYDTVTPLKYLDGSQYNLWFNTGSSRIMFYLNDGTLYTIFTTHGGFTVPVYDIFIDINGGKGPNVMGRDVFRFTRVVGKGILPYGFHRSSTTVENNCKNNTSYGGDNCAARIMNDGWEIKY